ncbi:MAG: RNA polymerase sigma factor [Patescibacteria group bacterium]
MALGIKDFLGFYNEYKKKVFNYILYRVSFDRDLAEDLTSEIFLKSYANFDRFDENRSFKTWIFTIAHNHLVNYYASKRPSVSLDDIQELEAGIDYVREIDQKLTTARLLKLLKTLPLPQQEVIMLRYVNDLSYSEIAVILEKDEGTVRTALSRALDSLRDSARTILSSPLI